MHGHVRQNHRISGGRGNPVAVGIHDKRGIIDDLTMSGSDHFDIIGLKFLQILFDNASEGHHDFGKIALGRLMEATFIRDKEVACCDMGTEKITTEKDFVFFQIGRHGLRPVNPGGHV